MTHPPHASFQVLPETRAGQPELRATVGAHYIRWVAAIGVAACLHAGAIYGLTRASSHPPSVPPEDAAIMITLAPISVSAKSQIASTEEGPESVATDAVADAPPEDEAEPDPVAPLQPDIPQVPPSVDPVAELPSKPPEDTQPVERKEEPPKDIPKQKPKQKAESAPKKRMQAATRNRGGPKSDVATGKTSSAPAVGGSSMGGASRAGWLSGVRRRIMQAKRYPSEARARREVGSALVSVTISANGAVTSSVLIRSAGSAALDREAVAVMRRAAPFPRPPDGKPTTLRIPINFSRR